MFLSGSGRKNSTRSMPGVQETRFLEHAVALPNVSILENGGGIVSAVTHD